MVSDESSLVPIETVTDCIQIIRGQKVILDADLARLYGVTTKRLNEQVRRNSDRFPEDFLIQLTNDEKSEVVANCDHLGFLKFSPVCPYAFTEHGAVMAASVLSTPMAVQVSVYVVRAFVKLRQTLAEHAELAHKLAELERRVDSHDHHILALIETIRELMARPEESTRKIGFHKD